MEGHVWAIGAGLNAALAAISVKFFTSQLIKYGSVVLFNVIMWGCYVNSLKALSSLQATVTNFATNWILSFSGATTSPGASLIVLGVIVLSKSSIEKRTHAS